MPQTNQSVKVPQVVISNFSTRDWQGVLVELEQSLRGLKLAQDLLSNIESSLLVSVQSLQEQQSVEQEI